MILSYRNTLHGAVTVIPCSTQAQAGNKWAFPLGTTIDGRAAGAICDKITTVAVSRLVPDKKGIVRMPEAEFDDMLRLVLSWLPTPSALPARLASPLAVGSARALSAAENSLNFHVRASIWGALAASPRGVSVSRKGTKRRREL